MKTNSSPASSRGVAPAAARADVYTLVTDRILAALDAGVKPWARPWTEGGAALSLPVRHNGQAYRGVNVLLLWAEAIERGYSAAQWMTYRQAQALGGQVRKGEHGSMVVFANRLTKTETGEDGEETERAMAFLKAYTVFNVEQIDGLPEQYRPQAPRISQSVQRIESAERFFANVGARVLEGGDRAYYAPGPDCIRLPLAQSFRDAQSYAATKAHEFIHWTGHQSRLARGFGASGFGKDAYAVEELVAELGAAFLCADLGISDEPRADHASYLSSWLKALNDDKRLIFKAAAQAQRAADLLHQLQPQMLPGE